jgi:hypothetical protein
MQYTIYLNIIDDLVHENTWEPSKNAEVISLRVLSFLVHGMDTSATHLLKHIDHFVPWNRHSADALKKNSIFTAIVFCFCYINLKKLF